jgi:hypothetical protein
VDPGLEERQIEKSHPSPALGLPTMDSFRPLVTVAGALLVVYLCCRIVFPFLTALCWAFALALIAQKLRLDLSNGIRT